MNALKQLSRLGRLAALALLILTISAIAANELVGGTAATSRLYSFMHRVPFQQDGYGTEYEIGRVYIVHQSRLIRPLESIRFAVDWEEPTTLVRSGRPMGGLPSTIVTMIDHRFQHVPADIRAEWAASIDALVQLALQHGPDAALAVPNQERDSTTFSYPIPASDLPISEEVFREGRVIVYPPALKVWTTKPFGFLVAWLVGVVLMSFITKVAVERVRRRAAVAQATTVQKMGSSDG
jgi:hypothetical protein